MKNPNIFYYKKVSSAFTPSITDIQPSYGLPGTFLSIKGDFKVKFNNNIKIYIFIKINKLA